MRGQYVRVPHFSLGKTSMMFRQHVAE